MTPTLQDNKINKKLLILYLSIFLICTLGIGVALYMQFFNDEKVEIAFGITDEEEEQEEEFNELKTQFNTIFTNNIDVLQQEEINIKKINDKFNDYVVTAYKFKNEDENLTMNVNIPFINVDDISAREFNSRISKEYKSKAETLKNQVSSINTIYSVEYKAYIQNNILSLIIRSEYKEGDKSQKIAIQTFNYDLDTKTEITIDGVLGIKNINKTEANNRIISEIKKVQNQNQALIEQGYKIYERDYTSDIYDISNVKNFLYGKDGILYIIFAYGNETNTSEIDLVIFK